MLNKQLLLSLFIFIPLITGLSFNANAQQSDTAAMAVPDTAGMPDTHPVIQDNYQANKPYRIAEVTISGQKYLDDKILKTMTGLTEDETVRLPNDDNIANCIRTLWATGMFSDIKVFITKVMDDRVFLDIHIAERPRLYAYQISGVSKNQQNELKDKLKEMLVVNRMVTEALKKDVEEKVKKYYGDKGYMNVQVGFSERNAQGLENSIVLNININRGNKVHINQINYVGNDNATDARLKRTMKGTKEMPRLSLYPAYTESVYGAHPMTFSEYLYGSGFLYPSKTLEALNPYFRWNIFSGSKFNPTKYDEDKVSLLNYYNSIGYRDAQITDDTTYFVKNGNLNVDMKVKEGNKYYFGDIEWKGNTKYSDSVLTQILSIKKGDIYDADLLNSRLGINGGGGEGGDDISTLYMDDGYLWFNIRPVEKSIVHDTINYEIVISEGPKATINKVTISGNTKTNDHVIRRELNTLPGNKFSKSDIVSSLRKINNLGYIDPEKTVPNLNPNINNGTVDIDYSVAEKSSDQLEVSAGYGGEGIGFTGSVGVVFNNFSLKNMFKPREWDPIPMGDGQKLSIRYQSSGKWYNSLSMSFTEPWLGGKKPTSLTVSGIFGKYSSSTIADNPNSSYILNAGGGVSIGKRLKWPDDNFVFSYGLNYQYYFLKDYTLFSNFENGSANNLSLNLTISRYTVDQPIYPRSGSNISLSFMFTPPYSSFSDKNYSALSTEEKYRWVEYHKYKFKAEWYQKIAGNFVLKLAMKYGFLGYYNKQIGFSPFEHFQVGGDGMSGFNYFVGRDIISLRGYDVEDVAPDATIFNKYTAEVRYPFSLNPSATIYGLAFLEAGNGWSNFRTYSPFQLYRSAGIGVRIFLPMFGLLGLDYGLGIDKLGNGVKFSNAFKFTFMLGQEPE